MAKQIRVKHSDNELSTWLEEHFVYEMDLFTRSVQILRTGKYDVQRDTHHPHYIEYWALQMSLLETTLTLLRNLHDFFYEPVPTNSRFFEDARAADYFDSDNVWKQLCPKKSELMKEAKLRIPKQVAHLTYERISGTPPEKEWLWTDLWRETSAVAQLFLDSAPPHRLGATRQRLAWLKNMARTY